MPYEVRTNRAAIRELGRLPKPEAERIAERIDGLAQQPRPPGSIKLANRRNSYRIRVGEYRLVYEISVRDSVVIITRIGHRRDVYRGL